MIAVNSRDVLNACSIVFGYSLSAICLHQYAVLGLFCEGTSEIAELCNYVRVKNVDSSLLRIIDN